MTETSEAAAQNLDLSNLTTLKLPGGIQFSAFGTPNAHGVLGIFNAADFGATGNGVTDDTAALQSAINAASIAGGQVLLKPGTYITSQTLTIDTAHVYFGGAGRRFSILVPTFAAGDVIQVGNGTNNPGYVTISGLAIIPSVARTAGSGINVRNGHDVRISDFVSVADFNAITLDGGPGQFEYVVDNFEINQPAGSGIVVGPTALVQDCWLQRGEIYGAGFAGLFLQYLSGGYFSAVSIAAVAGPAAVNIGPTGAQYVTALFCFNVAADTSSNGNGWQFGGTGQISNVVCVGCWASTCATYGVLLQNALISGVTFSGLVAINNAQHGVVINSGSDIAITAGSQIMCNSNLPANLNVYSGIYVGAGVAGFTIVDSFIGAGGRIGTNRQKYGLQVLAGCSNFIIKNNIILGNVTAAVSDASSGSGVLEDNVGFVTRAGNIATIGAGNTSLVVPHGLAATPGYVIVSPVSGIAAGTSFWADQTTFTATTFTLKVSTAGGAMAFAWFAFLSMP